MSDLKELPIEVRFSRSKSLWFDMIFVVGTQGRIVETSDTMWDIGELYAWLRGIAEGSPSVIMDVDREGYIDTLEVRYIDDLRCHLRISDWVYEGRSGSEEEPAIFVDAIVSRRKLVWEVYFELMAHSAEIGHRRTDKDWARLPIVEEWLEWEKFTNPFSFKDEVTKLERAW